MLSSARHKKESIRKIVRSILIVCVPITISSILSVATKSIDAVTVVRMLSSQVGEQIAQVQYGILAGKIETLIVLPFSFNIALRDSIGARSSESNCGWKMGFGKKKNRIFNFSNNTDRITDYSYYGCVFTRDIVNTISKCSFTEVNF